MAYATRECDPFRGDRPPAPDRCFSYVLGYPPRLSRGPLDPNASPRRTLSVLPAIALVAGSMLGIGIFIAPPVVAEHIHRPGGFLLVWFAGGVSALFGALCVAELGAMMPRAGGDYAYLRLAYGPGLAYAAGWLQLLAIFPGSLAAMAVGTAKYQLPILLGPLYELPGLERPELAWAIAIVVSLTLLNHAGVVVSGRLQVVLAGVPVAILLVASAAVFAVRGVSHGAWAQAGSQSFDMPGFESIALAFLPVYFAYSGWNAAIYIGAEIRDPARNLPRALVGGTIAVTVLYMVLCVGFLAVFSMDDLANTGEAGTAAAAELFGPPGKLLITTLIALAMLGSVNGTVLTGSRIAYAMARNGHFPAIAGRLHPRFETPGVALWLQAAWSVVLISLQSFEQLVNYASAAMLLTGTLTVMAVVVLRRTQPAMPRPYRAWGYPYTPCLYALSCAGVLGWLTVQALRGGAYGPQGLSVAFAVLWFAGAFAVHRWLVAPRSERARRSAPQS